MLHYFFCSFSFTDIFTISGHWWDRDWCVNLIVKRDFKLALFLPTAISQRGNFQKEDKSAEMNLFTFYGRAGTSALFTIRRADEAGLGWFISAPSQLRASWKFYFENNCIWRITSGPVIENMTDWKFYFPNEIYWRINWNDFTYHVWCTHQNCHYFCEGLSC